MKFIGNMIYQLISVLVLSLLLTEQVALLNFSKIAEEVEHSVS
jgi:hypothetical protein